MVFTLSQRCSTIDEDKSKRLLCLIARCLLEIKQSDFFSRFLDQTQTPDFQNSVFKATIGATDDLKIPMVIYGIGSIESHKDSRLQLALAILMRRRFLWIGEIEVFDPILNDIESRVLTLLGCSVLTINEECKREATKPMLFFMPHCPLVLYDNLLKANWTEEKLKNIILLGNNMEVWEFRLSKLQRTQNSKFDLQSHIIFARKFSKEFNIQVAEENYSYFRGAFKNLSWHSYNVIDYAKTNAQTSTEYIPWPSKN